MSYRGCGPHWRHLQPDGGPTTPEAALSRLMGPNPPLPPLAQPSRRCKSSTWRVYLSQGVSSAFRDCLRQHLKSIEIGVKPLTYWPEKRALLSCRQPCRCPKTAPITGFTLTFTPNQVTHGKRGNPRGNTSLIDPQLFCCLCPAPSP